MSDMDTLARTGDLDDRRLRAYLDALDVGDVRGLLGAGTIASTIHSPRSTWNVGDGRPGLADEDPAVMVAIARCATARWRKSDRYGDLARTVSHPERCGWCDYPAEELERALDWAAHHGQFITDEWEVWQRGDAVYRRQTGRAGTYAEPRFRAFAALAPGEQRSLVDAAVRASTANLEDEAAPRPPTNPTDAPGAAVPPGVPSGAPEQPSEPHGPATAPREHDPWCVLPPSHEGDCPPPEEER